MNDAFLAIAYNKKKTEFIFLGDTLPGLELGENNGHSCQQQSEWNEAWIPLVYYFLILSWNTI